MPTNLMTSEVADLLRAPVETVRYWRHVGKGPRAFKAGRRVLYAESDVIAWIEAQKTAEHGRTASSSGHEVDSPA